MPLAQPAEGAIQVDSREPRLPNLDDVPYPKTPDPREMLR